MTRLTTINAARLGCIIKREALANLGCASRVDSKLDAASLLRRRGRGDCRGGARASACAATFSRADLRRVQSPDFVSRPEFRRNNAPTRSAARAEEIELLRKLVRGARLIL